MYEMYEMYKMYEEYEVEGIWDSTVFAKELKAGHLLARDLPPWCDSRSTWEPASTVRHLRKESVPSISKTATSPFIDAAPPSANPNSTHLSYNTWAPPSPPSKLRLLVAHTDDYDHNLSEGLPVIHDTSTMTTWVKGCQLSTTRTNSSTLQATSTRGTHRRAIISNTRWLLLIWHDDDLCKSTP